jgi:hypothetical protein
LRHWNTGGNGTKGEKGGTGDNRDTGEYESNEDNGDTGMNRDKEADGKFEKAKKMERVESREANKNLLP